METKVINIALEGMVLPPPPGTCEKCAVDHDPKIPHNQESLFWQYWFYRSVNGERWPTWKDAMEHCDDLTKVLWTDALRKKGIEV